MYKTINGEFQSQFTEKKSKFISYAKHVETEEESLDYINAIKSKYWNATHNVYAYVLRNNSIQRYSDDGEPRGTAGVPVLNVIVKSEIYNIVVVVNRYFGGIMLGAGGLVRAYSNGCKLAIENSEIISIHKCQKLNIIFNYDVYSSVKNVLLEYAYKIINTIYDKNISIIMVIHKLSYDNFSEDLFEITSGKIIIDKLEIVETNLS